MTIKNIRTSGNSHVRPYTGPVYNHLESTKLRSLQGRKFRSTGQAIRVRMAPKTAYCRRSGSAGKGHSEYLSFSELAVYASVCVNTLKKWANIGMPVYKVGGVLRVKKTEFDAWMQQFRNGTESADLGSIWDQVMEEV